MRFVSLVQKFNLWCRSRIRRAAREKQQDRLMNQ
jgi:hypothetical protein